MHSPAYWPARIMLAIGICVTAIVLLITPLLIDPHHMSGDRATMFGVPTNVVQAVIAVGLAVVGLVWMLRIFRGPRDEPPDWRYRDR